MNRESRTYVDKTIQHLLRGLVFGLAWACGASSPTDPATTGGGGTGPDGSVGTGGSAGTSSVTVGAAGSGGNVGAAGNAGATGSGGFAGNSGSDGGGAGGSSGSTGAGGSAGSAGASGSGGAGTGGSAGKGGAGGQSSGTGGSGGRAGSGGSAGTAGAAGGPRDAGPDSGQSLDGCFAGLRAGVGGYQDATKASVDGRYRMRLALEDRGRIGTSGSFAWTAFRFGLETPEGVVCVTDETALATAYVGTHHNCMDVLTVTVGDRRYVIQTPDTAIDYGDPTVWRRPASLMIFSGATPIGSAIRLDTISCNKSSQSDGRCRSGGPC